MIFVLFIAANLLLMATLFAVGMYQFMQIEEKRKRRRLLTEAGVDVAELRALAVADRRDEAVSRLMREADVDRFTAESTVAKLAVSSEFKRDDSMTPGSGRM